jgi:hypothetical protein
MTKREAVRTLTEFRKVLIALDLSLASRAFDVLMVDFPAATMAAERAADARRALQTLRTTFAEIERKGIEFPTD